jgi:UDP-N-acetylglucosamine--N-acetylmuramyl-(pentapeptide) pyrophosphoryl-undecaprenol N-acetylglucosamine transferase
MKIIFTCGGTGGHIFPAVSVANMVRRRHPTAEILFVGAEGGMETRLVPQNGYEIKTVQIKSLRHSLSPKAIAHNAKVLSLLIKSAAQARKILDKFKPDIVVGTGGYASFPMVREAAKRGVPTIIHESNAMPGWTTRALASKVDTVLVSFEESAKYYTKAKRIETVGMPVREAFFSFREAEPDKGEKPTVLSFWGSLGARDMNNMMKEFIALEDGSFRHVHASGRMAYEGMKGLAKADVEILEFIDDMPAMMVKADLVICRAGASTLAELCAAEKPSILIPSPNVTNNHQDANARILERYGAAVRMPEKECTAKTLYSCVKELLADGETREKMAKKALELSVLDSTERIYSIIMKAI